MKKNLFIAGVCLLAITGLYGFRMAMDKMNSFKWMAGTWKMESKRGAIFEQWQVVDDSTMSGKSFMVKNSDTSLLETVRLVFRNAEYTYIPVAIGQNNDQPVKFIITSFDKMGFVAENPEHDFPKRISYRLLHQDSIHAFVDGGASQPGKRSDFYYSRIKN